MTRKHLVLLLIGCVVGLVLAWFTFSQVEPDKLMALLLNPDIGMGAIFAALLAYGCYFILKSLRWHFLLKPLAPLSTVQLLPFVIIGYAGNVIFPLQLGDGGRGYLLSKRFQLSTLAVLSTIAVEKIIDILALLILLLIALSQQEVSAILPNQLSVFLTLLISATLLSLLLLSLFPNQALAVIAAVFRYLPFQQICRSLLNWIEQSVSGLAALKNPLLVAWIIITTLIGWGFMLLSLELMLDAIGISVGIAPLVSVIFLSAVGLMLPTSPGFVGTIQAAFIIGLLPFQVDENAAVAASILYNAMITLPPLLAGLLCMLQLRIGTAQIGKLYQKLTSK